MINLSRVSLLESLSSDTVSQKAQQTINLIHQYTHYPIIHRIEFQEDVTQNDILNLIGMAKRCHEERAEMKRIEQIDVIFVRLCGLFVWECLGVPLRVVLYLLFLQLPFGGEHSGALSAASVHAGVSSHYGSTTFLNWDSILLCASLTGLWLLTLTLYISQLYFTRKSAFPLNYYLNYLAVNEWYKHSRAFWNYLTPFCNQSQVGSGDGDSPGTATPTDVASNRHYRNTRSIKLHLNELNLNHEILSSQFVNRLLCDDAAKFELHVLTIFTACVLVSFVNLFQLHHSIPYFYSYMASAFSLVVLCSFLAVSLGSRIEQQNVVWHTRIITILLFGCCMMFAFMLALKVEEQIPLVGWGTVFLPFSLISILGFCIVYVYACTNFNRMIQRHSQQQGDKERSATSPSQHSSAIALYRSSHYGMHSSSSSASLEYPRPPNYQW
eukprot:CAMPEP_0117444160 /NCGR_PEP_ID=MMETSP0759-20121206/5088_1 /TAXON_ID=63605 /ORGANISM="Percolomonas cosmopolitus, Strain WS" /LENGTH=438 /DNA_ID=CAMNT_0005236199 /DNA_START=279 /DNA_END=1592 /DNA_ORIENTATION=-